MNDFLRLECLQGCWSKVGGLLQPCARISRPQALQPIMGAAAVGTASLESSSTEHVSPRQPPLHVMHLYAERLSIVYHKTACSSASVARWGILSHAPLSSTGSRHGYYRLQNRMPTYSLAPSVCARGARSPFPVSDLSSAPLAQPRMHSFYVLHAQTTRGWGAGEAVHHPSHPHAFWDRPLASTRGTTTATRHIYDPRDYDPVRMHMGRTPSLRSYRATARPCRGWISRG